MLSKSKPKIWIFTFEYAGIMKVGGLGEVPANQAKNLVNDYDITVFIPSHGQIERLKKNIKCEKLPFNCIGQLDPYPLGISESESSYSICFYECRINDVKIILLSGDNSFTKKYLDDKIVYNPETFSGKMCLFSIGMSCYTNYIVDKEKEKLPELIHMHDYHVVIPFIQTKQVLTKNGLDVASIITFHLLTWPRYHFEFYKACGIDDTPIKIYLKSNLKSMTFTEIFSLVDKEPRVNGKYIPPTVEKVGAIISDLVTTVSESYLKSDIIPNLGGDLIKFKSDFVWDGCDWEYEKIYNKVMQNLGKEIKTVLNLSDNSEITREDLKSYLLKYKIGHLSQSPLINSKKVLDTINEISNGNPFIKNGNIKSFSESGPLVIATGRISPQKGFETIFSAIPRVLEVIPNAKFLLLILPTEYSLEQIKTYAQYVKQYPENLRIIFGLAADIFYLAHLAADAYCALSRWEPFGIIALEAMASKIPIIATKVGGLQESIIDVRTNPEYGTGILIEKDNPLQFAESLISILLLAEIMKKTQKVGSLYADPEILRLVNLIPDDALKSRVLLDANYYNKIKENSYNRVKYNFRWNIVSKKLVALYEKVKNLHQIS